MHVRTRTWFGFVVLASLLFIGASRIAVFDPLEDAVLSVADPVEWDAVFPALIEAMGLLGRLTLPGLSEAPPERRAAVREGLPLVRIRPTGIAPGPADPGGLLWLATSAAGSLLILRWLVRRTVRRAR